MFQSLRADPQTGSILEQDLDPVAALVGEHEQGTGLRVFLKASGDQRRETIEALGHVAGFHRQEDLQASGETQHDSRLRRSSITSGTWAGVET